MPAHTHLAVRRRSARLSKVEERQQLHRRADSRGPRLRCRKAARERREVALDAAAGAAPEQRVRAAGHVAQDTGAAVGQDEPYQQQKRSDRDRASHRHPNRSCALTCDKVAQVDVEKGLRVEGKRVDVRTPKGGRDAQASSAALTLQSPIKCCIEG